MSEPNIYSAFVYEIYIYMYIYKIYVYNIYIYTYILYYAFSKNENTPFVIYVKFPIWLTEP